jgi:multiple sugar transport system ATP-binding protein
LLDRKPKALSGGQRQRVAVGRAIVRQPAAFLFDEPLSNLDAKLRVEMRAELKRLHHKLKTTTVYVTHDQEEAMTLGDRIVVMSDGVIQQCATPLKVYSQPTNRFVAGFVGTPPMNFLEGRIADGQGLSFDGQDFRLRLREKHAARLTGWVGKAVVLGVRPEALDIAGQGRFAGEENVIPAKLNVIEPLGEKMDIFASTNHCPRIVGRMDARTDLKVDSRVDLHLDMGRIHVFAPGEEGENLTLLAV